MICTGVGSRRTPVDVLLLMRAGAEAMVAKSWMFRSGHAEGADYAFESGANEATRIFLPWPTYNTNLSLLGLTYPRPSLEAKRMAAGFHPYWENLSSGARLLHARNMHEVLGLDLDAPSDLLVCWTPDGATCRAETGSKTGGTGTAIRAADVYGVPVLNLRRLDHREEFERLYAGA